MSRYKAVLAFFLYIACVLLCGCSMKQKTDAGEDNRTEVVLGAVVYGGILEEAVDRFNALNQEYKVVLKDYGAYEDGYTRLLLDISSGNAPDIMELRGMPVEQFSKLGLFENLVPYFEQDKEIGLNDMVEPVIEASMLENNLFYIAPKFTIYTMMAGNDTGHDDGWTVDEMFSYVESKPEGTQLFDMNTKDDVLYCLLFQNFSDYIDWEHGVCSFDSEKFKTLLKLADCGQDSDDMLYPGTSTMERLSEGKQLFVEAVNADLLELAAKKQLFQDAVMIGFPNEDRNGNMFFFNYRYAMSSTSTVKDGVWEFMKIFLSKEFQYKDSVVMRGSGSIPTRKDCFDDLMDVLTSTETYTDEYGYVFSPIEDSHGFPNMDSDIIVKPFNEEEKQAYLNLIAGIDRVYDSNPELEQIIREEASYYFNREKSLEETVQVIQNRISRYVSERTK